MKRIIIICCFSILISGYVNAQDSVSIASDSPLNWQSSTKIATLKAKSQKKPILLFFTGSDWCGPCKMLITDFFESDKFIELANNEFILYEADFPRNQDLVSKQRKKDNNKLKVTYGVTSYPTIVIIDAKGNELGRKKGYSLIRDASYHFSFLESTLRK